MSSCTLLLCQSGSGSHHSLHTRTVRRRWPAGRSTIGCYSPDKGPDPGAVHNGGPETQTLNIDVKTMFSKIAFQILSGGQCLRICHLDTCFCYWVNSKQCFCAQMKVNTWIPSQSWCFFLYACVFFSCSTLSALSATINVTKCMVQRGDGKFFRFLFPNGFCPLM